MDKTNDLHEVLGDPPWDEVLLTKCYFCNPIRTQEIVQTIHPGAKIFSRLSSLRLSLNIFLDAVDDLISSINKFKGESAKPGFWNRPNHQFVEKLETAIQRGIASSAMCAMALVDHSRIFSNEYPVPAYDSKVNHHFKGNLEHRFIQSLRHYIAHVNISKADWTVTHSKEGRSVFCLLHQINLLKWNGWCRHARAFISRNPNGVNVEKLFDHYSRTVHEFHNWLRSGIMDSYGEQISQYLRYDRLMKRISSENQWKLLLKQVLIPKQIDPYMYLDHFFMRHEIEQVLSLPHRSKEQVDRIIELADEYGACTEELRQLVYEIFNVNKT